MKQVIFVTIVLPFLLVSCSSSEQSDNQSTAADSVQGNTEQTNPAINSNTFVNKAGNFQILFPGQPVETFDTVATQVGMISYHTFLYEESADRAYILVYGDYPESHIAATPSDTLLENAKKGLLSGMELTLSENDKQIEIEGYPGISFASNNGSYFIQYRIYLVNNRLFQVGNINNFSYLPQEESNAYFSSFALLH